jgi:hypothetical protein
MSGLGYGKLAGGAYFLGLMMATAVRGAVPAVTLVTAPLLCEGGGVEVHASWYRCLDGVKASVPTILGAGGEGMPDIIVVIALATLVYGTGFFLLAAVAKIATGSRKS